MSPEPGGTVAAGAGAGGAVGFGVGGVVGLGVGGVVGFDVAAVVGFGAGTVTAVGAGFGVPGGFVANAIGLIVVAISAGADRGATPLGGAVVIDASAGDDVATVMIV